MKLSTIHKRNNLNSVYNQGDIGPGNAYHEYAIYMAGCTPETDDQPNVSFIQF